MGLFVIKMQGQLQDNPRRLFKLNCGHIWLDVRQFQEKQTTCIFAN